MLMLGRSEKQSYIMISKENYHKSPIQPQKSCFDIKIIYQPRELSYYEKFQNEEVFSNLMLGL